MKTKKSIKIGFLALSLCLSVVFSATSQVTIGTLDQPLKGALLDLKESNTSNGDANSYKGLMLPRVTLININSLAPILSGADLSNGTLVKNHTGLIVYNVSTTNPFQKGLYSWDGTQWNLLSPISAENGLNVSNATVKLGGNLIQTTTINLNNNDLVLNSSVGSTTFDSSKGDLYFKSSLNKVTVGRVIDPLYPQKDTLHIKGNINIDNPTLSTESDDQYLVIDSTGTIRYRPSVVTRISTELKKGQTSDWSKADPDSIKDFYFIDKAHVIILPLVNGSDNSGGEIRTPGGTIKKFKGRVIRFFIYGGPGAEGNMHGITFKGVRVPSLWTIPSTISSYFTYSDYNGGSISMPLADAITGSLRIDDGGASGNPLKSQYPASRFRFIDIISDGEHWWVNNQ